MLASSAALWVAMTLLSVAEGSAVNPETSLQPPRVPDTGARCVVCGMLVASHPEWLAQLSFDDDSTVYFDGAKDMFTFLFNRDSFLREKRERKITAAYVCDYYSARAIPAVSATFVIGSDVLGPMGKELVAHATRADAEEFCRDHRGTAVVPFAEVDKAMLDSMR